MYPHRVQITLQFRSYVGPPQTSHASAPAAVSCVGIDACLRAAAIGRPTRSKAKRFAHSAVSALQLDGQTLAHAGTVAI